MFKQKKFDLLSIAIIFVSLFFLAVISYEFLKNWEIGYSSDTALIGLMAKSILDRGELPIYVWSVGYQGVLIEGYLTALFFSIFGVNPIVLNFTTTIVLWLALFVWTYFFSRVINLRVAALTLLATVLSFPLFYGLCLRTLPNFPEALLLGGLMFVMFDSCVKQTELENKISTYKIIILGSIIGFSLYTFAITVYYILPILFVIFIMHFRNDIKLYTTQFFKMWFFPFLKNKLTEAFFLENRLTNFQHKFINTASILGWFTSFIGFIICFWTPEKLNIGARVIKWNSLKILFIAFLLIFLPRLAFTAWDELKSSLYKRQILLKLFIGFIIGYSPAILFSLTGGHNAKQALASGNWSEISMRIGIYAEFQKILLHISPNWTLIFSLYFFLCIVGFFLLWGKNLIKYIEDASQRYSPLMLFGFLMFCVFCIFLVSKTVVDFGSVRYLIITVPIYAFMLSYCTYTAWNIWPKLRIILVCCYVGVLYLGAQSIYKDLNTPVSLPYKAIAHEMEIRDIKYAYADYWLAYATTFLANEKVILEPIYSNYSPHYKTLIESASRIAYIDYNSSKYTPQNGYLSIQNRNFKVTEEKEIQPGILLRVLEEKK